MHPKKKIKNKIAGVDNELTDANYLKLGYGIWTFNDQNEPVYSQYYFNNVDESDDTYIATETTFKKSQTEIVDYLTGKKITVSPTKVAGKLQYSRDSKPIEIYDKMTTILDKNNNVNFINLFKLECVQLFFKGNFEGFYCNIVKAYRNERITEGEVILLNRLLPPGKYKSDEKDIDSEEDFIYSAELDKIIEEYRQAKKGIIRKLSGGETQIMKALGNLVKDATVEEITRQDVEFLLKNRRKKIFSNGSIPSTTTTLAFFEEEKTYSLQEENTNKIDIIEETYNMNKKGKTTRQAHNSSNHRNSLFSIGKRTSNTEEALTKLARNIRTNIKS